MSTNVRHLDASPDAVWAVLSDGWLDPLSVVGATRMRDVESRWPAVGTRIHHSVGVWPLVIDDHTEVLACDPGRRLRLTARAWPTGEAVQDPMLKVRNVESLRRLEFLANGRSGA